MSTDVSEPTTPTQVLIPEAREHQKQRYIRIGIVATLCALLIASLIATGVVIFSGSSAGRTARGPSAPGAAIRDPGLVYFRPVLCFAPPYTPMPHVQTPLASPACSATSALRTTNLNVEPNSASPPGFTTNNMPADPSLAGVPSTKPSAEKADGVVLLPGLRAVNDGERYVLGPAQMTSTSVASANAIRSQDGQWLVEYTTTAPGASLWDKVARENFHQVIGIDFDGIVVSAPIMQPAQSSFSSFKGHGEIGGSLTKAEATNLAHALDARRG